MAVTAAVAIAAMIMPTPIPAFAPEESEAVFSFARLTPFLINAGSGGMLHRLVFVGAFVGQTDVNRLYGRTWVCFVVEVLQRARATMFLAI